MQHHRRVAGVVVADVFGAEALRHREIDLHRAALPRAADRSPGLQVRHLHGDFRLQGSAGRPSRPAYELPPRKMVLRRRGQNSLQQIARLQRHRAAARGGPRARHRRAQGQAVRRHAANAQERRSDGGGQPTSNQKGILKEPLRDMFYQRP